MLHNHPPLLISAAEITRNFGQWQERAGQGPLIVTHHGRPRVVMMAIEQYEALTSDSAADNDGACLTVLLGQIGVAFAAFDGSGRFVRLNSAATAQLGLPERLLVGRTVEEALGPKGHAFQNLVNDAIQSGEERQVDMPAPRGDRMLRMRVFAYPGGVATISRNVTGPLAAERAMAEHAAEAHARMAHGAAWIARLDARGRVEEVEHRLAALLGFASERFVGVRLIDIFSIATRARLADAIEAVLAAKGSIAVNADLLVNGQERPARIAIAERRSGGSITGATVLITA